MQRWFTDLIIKQELRVECTQTSKKIATNYISYHRKSSFWKRKYSQSSIILKLRFYSVDQISYFHQLGSDAPHPFIAPTGNKTKSSRIMPSLGWNYWLDNYFFITHGLAWSTTNESVQLFHLIIHVRFVSVLDWDWCKEFILAMRAHHDWAVLESTFSVQSVISFMSLVQCSIWICSGAPASLPLTRDRTPRHCTGDNNIWG